MTSSNEYIMTQVLLIQ